MVASPSPEGPGEPDQEVAERPVAFDEFRLLAGRRRAVVVEGIRQFRAEAGLERAAIGRKAVGGPVSLGCVVEIRAG